MREVVGNLWDYYGKLNTVVCITTNGTVTRTGRGVMGRGCAAEAKQRFAFIERRLGEKLRAHGNTIHQLHDGVFSFPVKHNWWEKADIQLIARMAERLGEIATTHPDWTYVLPRPGCGNGHIRYVEDGVRDVLAQCLPDNVIVITQEIASGKVG